MSKRFCRSIYGGDYPSSVDTFPRGLLAQGLYRGGGLGKRWLLGWPGLKSNVAQPVLTRCDSLSWFWWCGVISL